MLKGTKGIARYLPKAATFYLKIETNLKSVPKRYPFKVIIFTEM